MPRLLQALLIQDQSQHLPCHLDSAHAPLLQALLVQDPGAQRQLVTALPAGLQSAGVPGLSAGGAEALKGGGASSAEGLAAGEKVEKRGAGMMLA